jgi:GT2 family glycosyltransferase
MKALEGSSYPLEIIVVDNNSADNTVELLKKYPGIHILQPGNNLGFGKGNNLGIALALEKGADYIFLLNQDAWVFEDTIKSLIEGMEANARLGILSPFHYYADETTPDTSFATYLSRRTADADGIAIVPFVNAAAWMLSRKCVETVGYFEPLFGHYGEDRNYCDRVRYHKFLVGITKDAKIVHDRIITRNFEKDVVQSRYKILSTLIDPNRSIAGAYAGALREVFGLPKYFRSYYSTNQVRKMLGKLISFYSAYILNPSQIISARKRA